MRWESRDECRIDGWIRRLPEKPDKIGRARLAIEMRWPGGISVKKLIIVILIVMIGAGMLALVAGCGTDTKQAQQYINAGDEIVKKFQSAAQPWENEISAAQAAVSDPAQFSADVAKAKAAAGNLPRIIDEAKAEYEKIKGLKGVDDYARYASLEIEALDKIKQVIQKTNNYFDQMIALNNSSNTTGNEVVLKQYQDDITRLNDSAANLDRQAQKLKAGKNL